MSAYEFLFVDFIHVCLAGRRDLAQSIAKASATAQASASASGEGYCNSIAQAQASATSNGGEATAQSSAQAICQAINGGNASAIAAAVASAAGKDGSSAEAKAAAQAIASGGEWNRSRQINGKFCFAVTALLSTNHRIAPLTSSDVTQRWLCLAAGKSQAVAQAVAQALTSGDNSTAKAMVGACFISMMLVLVLLWQHLLAWHGQDDPPVRGHPAASGTLQVEPLTDILALRHHHLIPKHLAASIMT